jgi:hypothetical protein
MKAVVEIVAAVILLVSANYVAPKVIAEFKRETIRKVDKGLPPLQRFANQLIAK